MVNLTRDGTSTEELFCTRDLIETHENIIISSLNIALAITAFLGNGLTIVALRKPSSLHPPTKLLLGCLASTDFCVGLITEPLFVAYLLSPRRCYFFHVLLATIGAVFCGVSLITLTAISVDRLLALILGLRYRQKVTLRRVWIFAVTSWLLNAAIAVLYFYDFRMLAKSIAAIEVIFCVVTSTLCYLKIYLKLRHHQISVHDHRVPQEHLKGGIPLNITRYRKTVSSALWVQMTLLACYLPYGIISTVLVVRGSYTPSFALGSIVTLSLLFLNSSLNPLLYCWKMREVRLAVKDTIRWFSCFSR